MVAVNVVSGESNEGMGESGGMVGGSEPKTLAENPGDKGISRDHLVLDGESIPAGGKKYVDSDWFGINKYAAFSKNRIVEVRSQCSRLDSWESRGVMNMVGRVLGGKLSMDDEVDDMKTSEIGNEEDVVDKDACQGAKDFSGLVEGTGLNKDKASNFLAKGISINGEKDSGDLVNTTGLNKGKDLAEGTGLKEAQARTFNELLPDGLMETNDVEFDTYLVPKTRGQHQISEKVGEYYVSDLVWGKVRSHPWWPGQIFPPMAASDMAARHIRKQSYLIAYFGDQSFTWNEEYYIKPFRMCFSQMEKQSNSDEFCYALDCALDEVSRRVEVGLLCPCVSEDVHDEIKHQVVLNAGVWEEKNAVDGGDNISGVASFLPGTLMQFLESAAECLRSKTDRLQVTTAKAQLLAFNRWKGHYELPVFEEYFGSLDDDAEANVKVDEENDFSSRKVNSNDLDGLSTKRRHISGEIEFPTLKERSISTLMSSTFPISVENPLKRPIFSGKKYAESGGSVINKYAALSKNRIVEVRSQGSRLDSWESRGVMNMVGRLLGGKFSMDDEVEDLKTSEI